MDWSHEGRDWPNRQASRFINRGALTWHVQRMGHGPQLLLVHGAGAGTHSWRDLLPLLSRDFEVTAVDLPGHAFTSPLPSPRMGVQGMADALRDLLDGMHLSPAAVAGHSAGAAILTRLVLDGGAHPAVIVALNGSLLPIPGMQGQVLGGMAQMLAMMPAAPWFFSWHAMANAAVVGQMVAGTGSMLDERGLELYGRLMRDSGHVGGVLAMMAQWDLDRLSADLPRLTSKLVMIAAEGDKAIPVKVSRKVTALVPGSELVLQPGLGHLAHEEDPAGTAALVTRIVQRELARERETDQRR